MAKNLTRIDCLFRDLMLKYSGTKGKPMGLYYPEEGENARGNK
jgi:hypothetical protein